MEVFVEQLKALTLLIIRMTGLAYKAQCILEIAEQPSLCQRIGDGGKQRTGLRCTANDSKKEKRNEFC